MHVHMSVCFVYVLYISYAGCFTFFVASSLKENKPSSKKLSNQGTGHISRSLKKRHLQRALAGEGFVKEHAFVPCFLFQLILCNLLVVSSP